MIRLLSILFLVIVIGSCTASKNVTSSGLTGNWELTVFPSGDKAFAELFGERRPELQFDVSQKKVSGSTGCNRLTSTFSAKGNKLSFNNIATTKMACAGYEENTFLDALAKVNRYGVEGNQLRLLQDATLLMTFIKK